MIGKLMCLVLGGLALLAGPLQAGSAAEPRATSPSGIAFFGDSLTVAWGGNEEPRGVAGENWPYSVVAPALGLTPGETVFNHAESGSASSDIALKLGAIQPHVRVEDDLIPAEGAVAVRLEGPTSGFRRGAGFAFAGELAGVEGTLAHDGAGNWSFTRDAAGEAVAVAEGAVFVSQHAKAHERDAIVVWMGRNNVHAATFIEDVVRDAEAIAGFLEARSQPFLFLSITNGRYEGVGQEHYENIVACNAALAERLGERFLDVRTHLVERGLEEAGIAPTQGDLANIAKGRMPPSLMRDGEDAIHFNPSAYAVVARYLIDEGLVANGWFADDRAPLPHR